MVLKFLKSGFDKVKAALGRTRSFLGAKILTLFSKKLDATSLEELERALYEADLGVKVAEKLTKKVQEYYAAHSNATPDELLTFLKAEMVASLKKNPRQAEHQQKGSTHVILVVGVNGNGKTTSLAKLAKLYVSQGKKVLVGAGDTFRAAAVEQLNIWAKKVGADIVKGSPNSDPAAVAFDALTAAKARNMDIALIDTAGRLHTKKHLMQELEKIKRTCHKVQEGAPHETLLVLDATVGQNALDQAKIFQEFTPLTGLILTKLDGTAKGGIVFQIHEELALPIKYIGVGEGEDDLLEFDAKAFVDGLF